MTLLVKHLILNSLSLRHRRRVPDFRASGSPVGVWVGETVGWDISLDKFAKHLRTEQQRALGVLLVSHHEEGSNNDHIQCGVSLMSD